MDKSKTKQQLLLDNEELQTRLEEAEETLRAIRSGEVDALVVSGTQGDQIYTLQGADRSYRTLFETMEEGAATLSNDGTILYCNRRLATMLEEPLEKVIGSSLDKYLSPKAWQSFQNTFKKGEGVTGREEIHIKTATGALLPTLVSFSSIQVGDVRGICVTATDLTGQKRVEKELRQAYDDLARANKELQWEMAKRERAEQQLRQAQKMEAIGTLTGGIAHDFNNILASIAINADLALLDLSAESGPRHNLEMIVKAGQHGSELVKQMLLFSRKSGKKQAILTLTPLIKETFKLLRSSIPTTIQMELLLETESDAVSVDSSQIQQVIMNLCTNAAYAMRGTTGSIDISLQGVTLGSTDLPEADMQPGDYLVLSVKDTGSGMDEEVRKRIFEPFFSTKPVGEGTGLGLSVVYGIVKNHKGGITVYSEPGKGSIFKVYLPKVDTAPSVAPETPKPMPRGNERILVVDDEEFIANAVQNMLQHLGYKVTALMDSQGALKLFSENPSQFDLVIADQTMPFMTGEDLGKELMRIRPDIPVILCTGYSDMISSEKATAMGFRGFTMKPFTVREGAELVRRVLDQKEPSDLKKNP